MNCPHPNRFSVYLVVVFEMEPGSGLGPVTFTCGWIEVKPFPCGGELPCLDLLDLARAAYISVHNW